MGYAQSLAFLMNSSRKNAHPPLGRPLEIPWGRGVLKAKILEAKYEANTGISWGRGCKTKTFCGGGDMDIFWNCTVRIKATWNWPMIQSSELRQGIEHSQYDHVDLTN